MLGILLAVHVLVTMLLIFVILIQKSEGGSSLFASGAGNGMFTARGTSDILTKSSWVLASIFLGNCILMAHISSKEIKETNSIIVNQRLAKNVKKKSNKPSQPGPKQTTGTTNKKTDKIDKSVKKNEKPVAKPASGKKQVPEKKQDAKPVKPEKK